MKSLNRNEAIAVFAGIIVVVGVFVGTQFLFSGTDGSDLSSGEVAFLSGIDDQQAARDILRGVTSSSGDVNQLVVHDVSEGSGTEVERGSTVTVHYIGMLQSGTQFDNSFERGEPFTFTVGRGDVIEGWEEGLIGMKEGGERILVIPADMGYGNRAVGPVPANSTLLFAIQLISVE